MLNTHGHRIEFAIVIPNRLHTSIALLIRSRIAIATEVSILPKLLRSRSSSVAIECRINGVLALYSVWLKSRVRLAPILMVDFCFTYSVTFVVDASVLRTVCSSIDPPKKSTHNVSYHRYPYRCVDHK